MIIGRLNGKRACFLQGTNGFLLLFMLLLKDVGSAFIRDLVLARTD